MNKDIKQEWVDALRSGEYKQTKGNLRTDSGFCCLGVLCDLYAKHKPACWKPSDCTGFNHYWFYPDADDMNACSQTLPNAVYKWAELPENNPIAIRNRSLAELNDGGYSFTEIANIIEENL